MERKTYIKSKKFYLKGLANQLREFKSEKRQYHKDFRELPYEEARKKYENRGYYEIERDIKKAKYEFRHEHIAYCLARGRKYEQIESKVRENNEPNQDYIEQLLDEYPVVQKVDDEKALCANEE